MIEFFWGCMIGYVLGAGLGLLMARHFMSRALGILSELDAILVRLARLAR